MKKNKTTPILIISIFVTISSIVLFVFFLKIIENKNEHALVVLATLQDKLKEKEDSIALSSKISEIKTIKDKIDKRFVKQNEIDKFVDYLENLGLSIGSDISVKGITIPESTKDVISIKIQVIGTFESVMKSIVLLENIPYQISITQIYYNKDTGGYPQYDNSSPSSQKTKTAKWGADISFNILSLNQ